MEVPWAQARESLRESPMGEAPTIMVAQLILLSLRSRVIRTELIIQEMIHAHRRRETKVRHKGRA